jgi:predicted permease
VALSLLHLKAPPARAGEAVGVRSTITSASQTILPLAFGALGASLGLLVMFWAAAAVLAAGGVFAGRHR